MPRLYDDQIKSEIRDRFIKKVDELIANGKADSYKELCDSIGISNASFNQIKAGGAMPTLEMLYNLQEVYKVSTEHIMFIKPPKLNLVFIKSQLSHIQETLEKIDGALTV